MKRLTFLLLLGPTLGWCAPLRYLLSDQNGPNQITFESKVPAEIIDGSAGGINGFVTMDPDKPGLDLKTSITVPVADMKTGDELRDQHLRSDDWLDAERFPTIHFDLAPMEKKSVVKKGNGVWFVKAAGDFSLKGTVRRIKVPMTLKLTGNILTADGRFTVRLDDYGIRGPRAIRLIGVKVSRDVHVTLHIIGTTENSEKH